MSKELNSIAREKREQLKRHLPFILDMLKKLKNSEYEQKWQQIYKVITSDKM